MKCPSCGAENPDGQAECRACGLIFAKWQKRAEAAPAAVAPAPEPAPAAAGGGVMSWAIGLLLLAATAGSGAYLLLRQPAAAPGPRLIPPDQYKAEITALEAALYKDEPANFQDGMAVDKAASDIAGRLMLSRRLRGHPAVEKLTMLAGLAGGESGLTYPVNARRDWITMWEETRGGLFEKADWFHAPAFSDKAAAAAADPAKAGVDLQRVLGWADRLIAEGRLETQAFGKHDVNLGNLKRPPENERLLEQWRAWAAQWQQRVAEAAAAMPDPKAMPDRDTQEAHRALSQVLGLLAAPANPGPGVFLGVGDPAFNALYVPGESLRENWFNTAENWLKYPRSLLNKPAAGAGTP